MLIFLYSQLLGRSWWIRKIREIWDKTTLHHWWLKHGKLQYEVHGNVKSKLFPLNLKNKTTIESDRTKKESHSLRNTNKQTYIYKRKLLIIKDCMDCSHSFTKKKCIPFSADYWVVQCLFHLIQVWDWIKTKYTYLIS